MQFSIKKQNKQIKKEKKKQQQKTMNGVQLWELSKNSRTDKVQRSKKG